MKNEITKHTAKLNESLVRELEFYNDTHNFRYNLFLKLFRELKSEESELSIFIDININDGT